MSREWHHEAAARMQPLADGRFGVVMAVPPVVPSLEAMTGNVCAVVVHDHGLTWPDRAGRQLARDALQQGGIAVLDFGGLRDAMNCLQRLRREGVR